MGKRRKNKENTTKSDKERETKTIETKIRKMTIHAEKEDVEKARKEAVE